ncbi:MAG: methyl-accepting chemotaxis protein [Bacillota bacterium]
MKSMKVKIIAAVCFICTLCLALSSVVGYYIAYKSVTKEALDKLAMTSAKYGAEINGWMEAQGKIMDEIADSIQHQGNYDEDYLYSYLENRTKSNPYSIAVYLGFSDKRFVSGDGWEAPDTYDCTQRDWYVQAVQQKGMVYTAPYVDATTGEMIITIARPILKDGQIIGVLGNDIEVKSVLEVLQKEKPFKSGYGFMLDRDGNFVVHPNETFQPTPDGLINVKDVMEGKFAKALESAKGEVFSFQDYDLQEKYIAASTIASAGWQVGFAVSVDEIRENMKGLVKGFALVLLGSLGICSLLAFFISSSISKPIITAAQFAVEVGNLDIRSNIPKEYLHRQDEIGRFANAFQSIVDNLRQFAKSVGESSEQVAAASEELTVTSEESTKASEHIAISSGEVSRNAESQLQEVLNTASVIEEISGNIARVSENAKEINGLSGKVYHQSQSGKEDIHKIIVQMDQIEGSTKKVQESLYLITKSSDKMDDITNTIKAIAEQTNLLALNASIEAARAGEQGKGFAVVADEVRKLAVESQKAAEEINELIVENQQSIEHANSSMEVGTMEVKKGKEIVQMTVETFQVISDLVSQTNQQIQAITEAIQQIAEQAQNVTVATTRMEKTSVVVSEEIQSISAATEEQTASMEEIAALSHSLSQQAQELQLIIGRFKM